MILKLPAMLIQHIFLLSGCSPCIFQLLLLSNDGALFALSLFLGIFDVQFPLSVTLL
jgi:hypothetical protein